MSEAFCIAYKKRHLGRVIVKLSQAYNSLGAAIFAATAIAEQGGDLVELRGSYGAIISKQELERLVSMAARDVA